MLQFGQQTSYNAGLFREPLLQRTMTSRKHLISFLITLAFLLILAGTWLYPGGSQANAQASGFDWANNYLCNLFDAKGINGAHNSGRWFAVVGMVVLCTGFALFFFRFSKKIQHKSASAVIRYAGVLGMVFGVLVTTPYHNLMVSLASTCIMLATFYITVMVFMSRLHLFKVLTVVCLLLLYINAIIYYTQYGLVILPVMQKVNFLVVIVWVLSLDYLTTRDDFPTK